MATKRVKHAIKSDIPSVTDSVSKLVHIGKATVEKLVNLRQAAMDEGFAIQVRMSYAAKECLCVVCMCVCSLKPLLCLPVCAYL